jgi:predicted alpha/beta superfamily hydrolase
MRGLIKLILLVVIPFSDPVFSQNSEQEYKFYNSIEILYESKNVGDAFHVFISLPDGYISSGKMYPVLYLLDGDVSFGMGTSIARYLQVGGNIPELIIVGIGYGSVDAGKNKRSRDFKPNEGAENFLKFISEELIPFIDSKYRTEPNERTISGYSLAGSFALYTLFTKSETFNRYIIGSPYLVANDFSIFDFESEAAEKKVVINANLFISVGGEEPDDKYFNPIDSLVTKIVDHNYSGLNMETKVFDGGTHLLCPPEVLTYGLVAVFKQ